MTTIMEVKPRIFIGSSSESVKIAKEVKKNLEPEYECTIWQDNFFQLNDSTYHNLVRRAAEFDFGIFIGGKDDRVLRIKNGTEKIGARDNVYLEFGLYAGVLGMERTYFFIHNDCGIASDLYGITVLRFRGQKGVEACCRQLKEKLQEEREISRISLLPSTSLAIGYFENFLKRLCRQLESKAAKATVEIVIPDTVKENWVSWSQIYYKRRNAKKFLVSESGREIPVYIDKDLYEKQGDIYIIDIPLTLCSAFEAVNMIMKKDYIGETASIIASKEREIRNFIKTLECLKENEPYIKKVCQIRFATLS